MSEKLRTLRYNCEIISIVAIVICLVLTVAGGNIFPEVQVIAATIALTACAIKFGVEIASNEKFGSSIFGIFTCFCYIVASVISIL